MKTFYILKDDKGLASRFRDGDYLRAIFKLDPIRGSLTSLNNPLAQGRYTYRGIKLSIKRGST